MFSLRRNVKMTFLNLKCSFLKSNFSAVTLYERKKLIISMCASYINSILLLLDLYSSPHMFVSVFDESKVITIFSIVSFNLSLTRLFKSRGFRRWWFEYLETFQKLEMLDNYDPEARILLFLVLFLKIYL